MDIIYGSFEWDVFKDFENVAKHQVDFVTAVEVFKDPFMIVAVDEAHSALEDRFFCIGMVGEKILTVRFTYRGERIRIIGAGYWRRGKELYEEKI